jgi:hypothetical protein
MSFILQKHLANGSWQLDKPDCRMRRYFRGIARGVFELAGRYKKHAPGSVRPFGALISKQLGAN